MNVYIETMGCSKNEDDSIACSSFLLSAGHKLVLSPEEADCIIVNTCGFIESAKKESIEKIFDMSRIKTGSDKKLIVTGCLAQRYGEELFSSIPEVDCFVGVGKYSEMPEILEKLENEKNRILDTENKNAKYLPKTDRNNDKNTVTATIKIAEGCNNACTYCVIPSIRGRYRSKLPEDIISEAETLVSKGCIELILTAQDISRYGIDIGNDINLSYLLKKLCKVQGLQWIRLMYCYEDMIDEELVDVIANEEKICKYLDIPIQHVSDEVLKRMNRKSTKESILQTIELLRAKVKNITLRTTIITGFPGESEEDFEELLEFVKSGKFDRLGVFTYSQEENTIAAEMEDQIPDDIKEKRAEAIMLAQMDVSLRANKKLLGKIVRVMVDKHLGGNKYVGRMESDAPEIDDVVYFTSKQNHDIGDFARVLVNDADEYDLSGIEVN